MELSPKIHFLHSHLDFFQSNFIQTFKQQKEEIKEEHPYKNKILIIFTAAGIKPKLHSVVKQHATHYTMATPMKFNLKHNFINHTIKKVLGQF